MVRVNGKGLTETSPLTHSRTPTWSVFGFILWVLVGLSPQLMQNAVFTETPVFAAHIPDGVKTSSHIVAAFFSANLVAALYFFMQLCKPISYKASILVLFATSVANAIVTAFIWDKTLFHGESISFLLMAMAFIAGSVGNTSILVLFPYASQFHEMYTTALSIGYGISGAVTFLLSLGQNTGSVTDMNFSVKEFFIIIASLIGICSLSAVQASQLPKSPPKQPKKQHINAKEEEEVILDPDVFLEGVAEEEEDIEEVYHSAPGVSDRIMINKGYESLNREKIQIRRNVSSIHLENVKRSYSETSAMFVISVITFYIPGLIPFFGGTETQNMWLNGIFMVIPTLGSAATSFFKIYRLWPMIGFELLAFVYLLVPCFKSSQNAFPTSDVGLFILLCLITLLSGYINTMVYLKVRRDFAEHVESVSRIVGLVSQLGGMIGVYVNVALADSNVYTST